MKVLIQNLILSMLLTLIVIPAIAQRTDKKPVGEVVYKEYKEKDVEKAIEAYHQMKRDRSEEYLFDEFQLNRIGYKMMDQDQDLQAAEKIFKLNMQEFPQAMNPMDSYADLLVKMGELEEARKYYQKALEAYSKQGAFERRVSKNSKAKLAVLENKHLGLHFLEGTWSSDNTFWNAENQPNKEKGEVTFTNVNNLLLVGEMKPESRAAESLPGFAWVVTYNAQEDIYETAWIGPDLSGLSNSTLKVESEDEGNYVLVEQYKDEHDTYVLRHEINTGNNVIEWLTFESKNGSEPRKVAQHDMTKKVPVKLTAN